MKGVLSSSMRFRWWLRRVCDIAMAVLFCAALLKFYDMHAWGRSLDTWSLIPSWAFFPILIGVPGIEMGVSGAWFLRIGRVWPAISGVVLVTAFTAIYAMHYFLSDPPDCGCLGQLLEYRALQDSSLALFGRNTLMLSAMVAGVVGSWGLRVGKEVELRDSETIENECPAIASRRATTLIETLLAIALIGIILSLLVPMIGGVRDRATQIGSQSNLRQHVANFTSYTIDHRGNWPRYTHPEATWSVIRHPRILLRSSYFGGFAMWNVALAEYYGDDPFHPSFAPPGYVGGIVGGQAPYVAMTPYFYSHTFISSPAFWNEYSRRGDRSQWQSVRADEVVSPSAKGLLLDAWSWSGTSRHFPPQSVTSVLIGFVDGSGRDIPLEDLTSPFLIGPPLSEEPYMIFDFAPVMATRDGVAGRDVR